MLSRITCKEPVDNRRCDSHEIPYLNDLDGLGVLGDERYGDKPSFRVNMFRGGLVV